MTNHKCIPPQDLLWAVENFSHNALKAYCYFWAVAPYKEAFYPEVQTTIKDFCEKTNIPRSSLNKALKEINESNLFKVYLSRSSQEKTLTKIYVHNKHGVAKAAEYISGDRTYKDFLYSEYWQDCRNKVLARDKFRCQDCGTNQSLRVHHLNYDNHGNELEHLEDLITLCNRCHRKAHT